MHEGKETLKQVIMLHIRKKITSNYSDEARFTIHFVVYIFIQFQNYLLTDVYNIPYTRYVVWIEHHASY